MIRFLALAWCFVAESVVCDPSPDCDEAGYMFSLPEGGAIFCYGPRGQPKLGEVFSNATTAVIMVHGTDRNANNYLCWALQAVEVAGLDLSSTFVVAPFFPTQDDNPPVGALFWDDNGGWKVGDPSTVTMKPRVSSYAVLDQMLQRLANSTIYPNLQRIILTGHSAGGQVVSSFAVGSRVDLPMLSYRPANPSTWTFLDNTRPGKFPSNGTCEISYCDNSTIPKEQFNFSVPSKEDIKACPDYNEWRYGFEELNDYMKDVGIKDAIAQFAKRVRSGAFRQILGDADVCNEEFCPTCDSEDIDNSCGADMQGLCRLHRGWSYYHFLQQFFNVSLPPPFTVPEVGHDACGIFTSSVGVQALFGV